MRQFVACGAPEEIAYLAKPHIGTDRLRTVVRAMREEIVSLGGEVRFSTKLKEIRMANGVLRSIVVSQNGRTETVPCASMVLAIGQGARDTVRMLFDAGIAMAPKAFAVGVRAEHPQTLIDRSQYGEFASHPRLGAAEYRLTGKSGDRGVYTFCMCPGGRVVASASGAEQIVVNGMSDYARDGENANAAVVVQVGPEDFGTDPLAGLRFQERLETDAFRLGGGLAPACRVADFLEHRKTTRFQSVRPTYRPAVEGANLCVMTGLPEKVLALPAEFKAFDPKGAIEDLFAAWEREARNLLLIALLALCAVLAVLFRRACLDFILPIWVAYCATEGLLIFMGETLNFFAVIGFFIFIGLGLDYCVFRWHARQNPHGPTENAVWYSFLTSLVAFGMLGFTEFAVTRLMGIILAFGLAVAYLAAKLCCGRSCFLPPNGQDGRCPRDVLDRGGCPTGRTGVPPVRNGQDARCPSGAQFSALNPQSAFAKVSVDKPSTPWHEQKEQCASRFWMQFMWYSYAWFGKTFQKLIFLFAIPFIYFFSKPARAALRKFYGVLSEYTGRPVPATHGRMFRHVLGFAWSLMDKTDAATLKKDLPEMSVRDDDGWRAFKGLVDSGKGAFILCTHVGVIGVLPALENVKCKMENVKCAPPKVHAFQQMGHDAVFMRVYLKHFDRSKIELHAVEEIGVETAVEMQAAIRRGELVIMAGDRTSAGSKSVLRHRFLGRDCVWPKGAFKFAALMEAPVFGVTCIHTGWNRYEVHVAALSGETLLADYVRFLEAETVAHPEQWYQFYDFFGGGDA